MSTVIVSVMLVAVLYAMTSARAARAVNVRHTRGALLAQDLLSEIMARSYADETDAFSTGPGPDETVGNRSGFDDVDDYWDWQASPPQDRNGDALPGLDHWQRKAEVRYVSPDALDTVVTPGGSSVKRIRVIVLVDGRPVAEQVGYRADVPELEADAETAP